MYIALQSMCMDYIRPSKKLCPSSAGPARDGRQPAGQPEAHHQQRRVLRPQPLPPGHRRCHGLRVPGAQPAVAAAGTSD